MERIYSNDQYRFYLIFSELAPPVGSEEGKVSPAHMQVIREDADGRTIVLMDYFFPVQLIPEVHVGKEGEFPEQLPASENIPDQSVPDVSNDSNEREKGRERIQAGGDTGERVLRFSLTLEVHHVNGMAQGEFTEEERYEVRNPFSDHPECYVMDIARKTRFASEVRHLEHIPRRTYPPVDGKQGPYGHPLIRNLPVIPRRHHSDQNVQDSP